MSRFGFLLFLLSACSNPFSTLSTDDPWVHEGPCADGGWGYGGDEGYIHVSPDEGEDMMGAGTSFTPVATLSKALELVEDGEGIFLWPGVYTDTPNFSIAGVSNIRLAGCGSTETVIALPAEENFYFRTGVLTAFEGINVTGGENTLTFVGDVNLQDVKVRGSAGNAVSIQYAGGIMKDVSILGAFGYGLHFTASTFQVEDLVIEGVSSGMLVTGASDVDASDLQISNTQDREFGFGLYVDHDASLHLSDSIITNTYNSGILVSGATELSLENVTINNVLAGDLWCGDGVVVMNVYNENEGIEEELYSSEPPTFSATDLLISDVDRAGIIVENGKVIQLDNVTISDVDYMVDETSIVLQGDSEMLDLTPPLYLLSFHPTGALLELIRTNRRLA